MGFYPPDALVHEAQRRGMDVLPPHVNRSSAECRVEERARRADRARLRPGREGGGDQGARRRARAHGAYRDAGDLAARSGAGRDTLERLAWAARATTLPRREALWQMGVVTPGRAVPGGVQLSLPLSPPEAPALRALTAWERLLADYGSFKISIAEHPMALLRPDLPQAVTASRALERTAARQPRDRRRPGGRAPAPGDREGRDVHAARGRVGNDQPDRPAARVPAPPPGRARGAVRARERPPRAPPRHDQRAWSTRSRASSGPTCRSPT